MLFTANSVSVLMKAPPVMCFRTYSGLDVICGLSLVFLYPGPLATIPDYFGLTLSPKNNSCQFQDDLDSVDNIFHHQNLIQLKPDYREHFIPF